MKKCWIMLLCLLLLSGCGTEEPMETVSDELLIPVLAPAKELVVPLPVEASQQVIWTQDSEKLYFCDGYSLAIQTLAAGDLERTVQSLCGYGTQELTILKTRHDDIRRYDWVWTSAGEGGDQIGRAAVLDDGSYHYCVSVMAEENQSGQLEQQWEKIFSSMSLSDTPTDQGS